MANGISKILYRNYKGYLDVNVYGFSIERFVNLAIHNGMDIWNVHVCNGYYRITVYVSDYRKLYTFAKKSGIKLKIANRNGLPFFVYKYRKRYVFFAGIFLFFILLYFMSSFIWLIEVEGNYDIDDYKIVSALNKYGLSLGSFKYAIDTDKIQQQLKIEFDEISWINIEIDGTKATIFITENIKDTNMVDNFSPCDIISNEDALITDIIADTGTPLVKVGDVVKTGDVLISGDVTYTLDGVDTLYKQVYSSGTVRGKVTRKLTADVPYKILLKRYTGNSKSFYNIRIFTTKFNTNFLKKDIGWKNYDIITDVRQPSIGTKFALPIINEKVTYREYTNEYVKISDSEAKKIAEKLVDKQILKYYNVDSDIISKSISFSSEKDKLTAAATIVSTENLGKVSYIFSDATSGGNTINGATQDTNSE
jgi:similar to stage IV sporulation protein